MLIKIFYTSLKLCGKPLYGLVALCTAQTHHRIATTYYILNNRYKPYCIVTFICISVSSKPCIFSTLVVILIYRIQTCKILCSLNYTADTHNLNKALLRKDIFCQYESIVSVRVYVSQIITCKSFNTFYVGHSIAINVTIDLVPISIANTLCHTQICKTLILEIKLIFHMLT